MERDQAEARTGAYRWYVLILLTLVYAVNFIDRQIVVILAPYLKADLGLGDAQVGLLYGTAFALFYALFGIPLARLADDWHRARLLSLGLAAWSAMTALSGMAGSFAQLALARVGVGVGEASASPAAFSLLQDYFPKRRRATALAIYSSGIYLGLGASLMIGGKIVGWWQQAYGHAGAAPFGLAGWQAAYVIVGVPGLLLAAIVALTVREPLRGAGEGRVHTGDPRPFRAALGELATLVPLISLVALRRLGAPLRTVRRGGALLVAGIVVAAVAVVMTDSLLAPAKRAAVFTVGGAAITANMIQWGAIAVGALAAWSWTRSIRLRDPTAAALMLDAPSFVAVAVAGGLVSFGSYGISAFLFVYGKAELAMQPEDGVTAGAIATIAGGLGTVLGGVLADAASRRHPGGRLYVAAAAAALSAAFAVWQFTTSSQTQFYLAYALGTFSLTMWLGPAFAAGQGHVLPRMRGAATALQLLAINLIGLGLGPYWVGLVSDASGSLRAAIFSALLPLAPAIGLFLFAARRMAGVEERLAAFVDTRRDRRAPDPTAPASG